VRGGEWGQGCSERFGGWTFVATGFSAIGGGRIFAATFAFAVPALGTGLPEYVAGSASAGGWSNGADSHTGRSCQRHPIKARAVSNHAFMGRFFFGWALRLCAVSEDFSDWRPFSGLVGWRAPRWGGDNRGTARAPKVPARPTSRGGGRLLQRSTDCQQRSLPLKIKPDAAPGKVHLSLQGTQAFI